MRKLEAAIYLGGRETGRNTPVMVSENTAVTMLGTQKVITQPEGSAWRDSASLRVGQR